MPGGTIVRLFGSGVPAGAEWDTQYWRLRTSWQAAMTRLKVYVEKQMKTGSTSMIGFLLRAVITAAGLWLATQWVPGVHIDTDPTLLIAARAARRSSTPS